VALRAGERDTRKAVAVVFTRSITDSTSELLRVDAAVRLIWVLH